VLAAALGESPEIRGGSRPSRWRSALGSGDVALTTRWPPGRDHRRPRWIVVSERAPCRRSRRLEGAMRQRALSAHRALLRPPLAALAILSRAEPPGRAMLPTPSCHPRCLVAGGFSLRAAPITLGNAVRQPHFTAHPAGDQLSDRAASGTTPRWPPLSCPSFPSSRFPTERAEPPGDRVPRYDGLHGFSFGLEFIL